MTAETTRIRHADLNDEARALEIEWADGHASRYPLRHLREQCPCASCRAERDEARANPFRILPAGWQPPSDELVNVEAVGRYALRLVWQDGHATGIYTFEYLREICPCDACRAARPPDDAPFVHGIHIPRS